MVVTGMEEQRFFGNSPDVVFEGAQVMCPSDLQAVRRAEGEFAEPEIVQQEITDVLE